MDGHLTWDLSPARSSRDNVTWYRLKRADRVKQNIGVNEARRGYLLCSVLVWSRLESS
jgi:hypothetical protein